MPLLAIGGAVRTVGIDTDIVVGLAVECHDGTVDARPDGPGQRQQNAVLIAVRVVQDEETASVEFLRVAVTGTHAAAGIDVVPVDDTGPAP